MDESIIVDQLRLEISRLQCELDQATSDKEKAAEYGLAVLEDKHALQLHCDHIESMYESSLQELQRSKDVRIRNSS